MSTPLDEYKTFIDALVKLRPSVSARRVQEGVWHREPPPDQVKFNKLLSELSPGQREIVAEIAQGARDSGIHDVLVYLTDQINLRGLRLVRNGVEFPVEPFGTEMYYDWVCRREGDEWPEGDQSPLPSS
jgi:uncharacterized protein DUF6547